MKLLLNASAAMLLLSAGDASAAPELTASVGYAQADLGLPTVGMVQARVGARFTPHFGVEAELGYGLTTDTVNDCPGCVIDVTKDVSLKGQAAAYGVAFLPLGEHADVFFRAGYGVSRVHEDYLIQPFDNTIEDSGAVYGVGAQWFAGANGVRADYTHLQAHGGAEVVSISYVRKFP